MFSSTGGLPPSPALSNLRVRSRCLVRASICERAPAAAAAAAAAAVGEDDGLLVPLSPIDHVTCPATLYQMLCFEGELPQALLQESLATTLQLYPLLAGRMVVDKGMYAVRCNNAGALFISASCDNTLQDFMPPPGLSRPSRQLDPLPLARQLRMPIELCGFAGRPEQHLLGVAALQLAGGDSALMLLLPHSMADLASNRRFVRDWAAVMSRMQQAATAAGGQLRASDVIADPPTFGWQRFDALADCGERLEARLGPAEVEQLLPRGLAAGGPSSQQPAGGMQPSCSPASSAGMQQEGSVPHSASAAPRLAPRWLLWLLLVALRQLQLWASFYCAPTADALQPWLSWLGGAAGTPSLGPGATSIWPCTKLGTGPPSGSRCSSQAGTGSCEESSSGRWRYRSHLASRYNPLRYLLARASLIWHTRVLGAGDVLVRVSAARLAQLKAQAQAELQPEPSSPASPGPSSPSSPNSPSGSSSGDLLVELDASGSSPSASAAAAKAGKAAPSSIAGAGAPSISRNDALVARVWQVLGGLPGKAGRLSAVYLAVDMRRRLPQVLSDRSFGNWLLMVDTPWADSASCSLGALAAAFRRVIHTSPERFQLECAAMRRKVAGGLTYMFWRHLFWIPWAPVVITNWDWAVEDAQFTEQAGSPCVLVWILGGFNTPTSGVVKLIRALDGSGDVYVHMNLSGAAAAAMLRAGQQL